jgi:hypothetical protein
MQRFQQGNRTESLTPFKPTIQTIPASTELAKITQRYEEFITILRRYLT